MTCVVLFAAFCLQPTAFAQLFGAKGSDPTEQLSKLFGSTTAFSATAVMTMRDKNGKITTTTEANMAMLDGKLRTEFDLTKVKGSNAPDQSKEEKQLLAGLGINRTLAIARPDKKLTYIIFPDLKAYYEEPMVAGATQQQTDAKVEKVPQGNETVDGHPCAKSLVTITTSKGERLQAIVWEATDLKNFPLKSQYNFKDGSVVVWWRMTWRHGL